MPSRKLVRLRCRESKTPACRVALDRRPATGLHPMKPPARAAYVGRHRNLLPRATHCCRVAMSISTQQPLGRL
jgi:hypothetical protein